MAAKPDASAGASLAQHFTPPDVALWLADNLLLSPDSVFDPSCGKGSLLIAAGLVMALKFGLRSDRLLSRIKGCEICPNTRNAAINNILTALAPWLNDSSNPREMLSRNIILGDFLKTPLPSEPLLFISNPPYREFGGGNIWLPFMEKTLNHPRAMGAALVLPVSAASAARAGKIRETLATNFKSIRALHHEIRPRPLFRGVEQRISLICALKESDEEGYRTTGFLTHRAGERASVWAAPFREVPLSPGEYIFPKIGCEEDLSLFRKSISDSLKIGEAWSGAETEVWVRTSGRYSMAASFETPDNPDSSKWRKLRMPKKRAKALIRAFKNGGALRWWRIFGDGRDLSLKRFLKLYPAEDL